MGEMQNGGRWYDNTRIIWGLFVIIGILVGYVVMMQSHAIDDHSNRINRLEAQTEVNHEILKTVRDDIKEIKASLKKGP